MVVLQIDFPFKGPWGGDMTTALEGLARDIVATPGLVWKIWTENREKGHAGGIYLFSDHQTADSYRTMHTARLEAFGITGVRALTFDVNEALSRINGAPM